LTILITGSSGFTGQILIPKLKKLGFNVLGLDWKKSEFTDIVHDISKPIKIEETIDIIIHLAARLEHDRCTKNEYYLTNVVGTENILKFASKHKSSVIYISTTAIYGSPDHQMSEETKILPMSDYATTKWQGEKICEEYKKKGIDITIVRPSVLIGKKRLGIYSIIFKNLHNNSPIPLLGNGLNKISFVNIDDFSEFLIFLIQKNIKNLIVNFGGTIPGTLNEIIEKLKNHVHSDSKIIHLPIQLKFLLEVLARLKFIPVTEWQLSVMYKNYTYDNRILFSTGYSYKYDSMNALKEMADYYKSQNIL